MNKMPYKIKEKIRQVQSANQKARKLDMELSKMFDKYGIDIERLTACSDCEYTKQTPALAYVSNCEGNVEDNIKDIERIFLMQLREREE